MATLAEQLTALTNNLKQAKIAYATVVRNKESSTIVSRAKARLDEAQKAYDLSAPQRSDIATAKAKTDPDYIAAKANQTAAEAEVAATKKSIADAKARAATSVTTVTAKPIPVTPKVLPKNIYDGMTVEEILAAVEKAAAEASTAAGSVAADVAANAAPVAARAAAADTATAATAATATTSDTATAALDTTTATAQAGADTAIANATAIGNELTTTTAALTAKNADLDKTIDAQSNKEFDPDAEEEEEDPDAVTTTTTVKTVGTFVDPETGDVYAVKENGDKTLLSIGTKKSDANTKAKQDADDKAAAAYEAQMLKDAKTAEIKATRESAYQVLKNEFMKYDFDEDFISQVKNLILTGTPVSEATLKLRGTDEYAIRFAGNQERRNAGKNVYDEATYLSLENQYRETFGAYGLDNLLGDKKTARAKLAQYIGQDKSPLEIKKRIQIAVEQVQNRLDVRLMFDSYYPDITDKDLVSYFLEPKETLASLESKVSIASVGSTALRQGLVADYEFAKELSEMGVSEEQAAAGYKNVANVLPDAKRLTSIEGGKYTQSEAENAYLKQTASEQRKLAKLAEREQARFASSSGINKTSLTSSNIGQLY